MNPSSSDPHGRYTPGPPAGPPAQRDPRTGRLRASDPRHPLSSSNPNHPALSSSDPNHPALSSSDPNHPALSSSDPNHPALSSSDPNHPALRSSDPNHPALRSSDPNHPALRSSDPNHPALRSSDPNHPALRSSDPNHPALRSSDPNHPALSGSSPDHRRPSDQGRVAGSPRRGPRRIGRYAIHEELGRGNYGVVYRATREGLDRAFALKILTSSALQNEEAQARFEREARVASKLDHPGIVPVFDVGKEGGLPYFVMDYVPGCPLSSRLKEKGHLKPAEAARLISALADAVAVAHAKGVIHRDLKPDNVMLQSPGDRPRIMDFGLARDSNASMSLTKTGEAIGTPYYMAPEQIRGRKDVDARADVYALGVVLYECLTGQVPFPGSTFMEIAQRVRQGWVAPPTQVVSTIPKRLEEICLQAMALERDQRYADAQALHEDLSAFLRASGELEGVDDAPSDRRPVFIAAAVTVLLALATLGVLGLALRKQARENEARALIAEANSSTERDAAESLLKQAEALANGDADLVERIRVAREAQASTIALARLRDLVRDGALGEVKVHLDSHAHLPAVRAEATRLATELIEQAQVARDNPALEDRALSQLTQAQELALEDELRERIRAADRALRARRFLRRGQSASRQNTQAARALLTQAETLAEEDEELLASIRSALGALDVRAQLAQAWRAGGRGARLPELLRRIESARAPARGDPDLLAEVDLARVEAHYKRGAYAKAVELARALNDRSDRSGYVARYFRGMSEFRLEQVKKSASTLRGVMTADPNGVGGLLAGAFVNTVMVAGGAAQGEVYAKRALQREPNNADALVSLAFSLHNQSRYAAAWRHAQKAITLAPDHPRAYLAKGFIQQAGGDMEVALEGYAKVIALTEPRPMRRALQRRALISRQLRRYASALADLSRLLEERPNDVTILILRAGIHEESGQSKKALADWKRAAKANLAVTRRAAEQQREPYRSRVLKLLGIDSKPKPKPAAGASKGPARRAFDPETPLGRAVASHRQGRPLKRVRAAFAAALDAAKGKKEKARVQVELADVLYRRGQTNAAFEVLRPLVERKDVIGQRAQFIQAFCQLWASANTTVHTFRAAFHRNRKSIWGLNSGAALHTLSQQIDRGIQLSEQGIALDPNEIESYLTLVFALSSRPARHAEAERIAEQAVRVAPRHSRAHLAHAYILGARRNAAAKIKALDRAIAVSQPFPIRHALQMRCQSLMRSKPKQAVADADMLLKRNPSNLQMHMLKALACEFLNDRAVADAAWRAGFKVNRRKFKAYVQQALRNNPQLRARALKLADE